MDDMEGKVEGFFVSKILMTFEVKFPVTKFVSTRFPCTLRSSFPLQPYRSLRRRKRSVFLCFLATRVELMTSTQKKMLRYGRDENRPTCLFTLLDPSVRMFKS